MRIHPCSGLNLWPMGVISAVNPRHTPLQRTPAGPIARPAVAQGTGETEPSDTKPDKKQNRSHPDAAFQPDRQNRRHHGRQRI